jgi:hypothetical protein
MLNRRAIELKIPPHIFLGPLCLIIGEPEKRRKTSYNRVVTDAGRDIGPPIRSVHISDFKLGT